MIDWATFKKRKPRKKSDFNPDSEYIRQAEKEYEKNGGIVTVLPTQTVMGRQADFSVYDEVLGNVNLRGIYD